jgi:hypothetical protein
MSNGRHNTIIITIWWGQDKGEQCAVRGKKVLKRIRGTKEENVIGRYRESLDDRRNFHSSARRP